MVKCVVCDDAGCSHCPAVRQDGTTRTYRGYVDEVEVIGGELGFELHLTDENGDAHVFNVHRVAEKLYRAVRAQIGPWLDEAAGARAMPGPVTAEDVEGYEPGDPKRVMLAWEVD